MNVKLTDLEPVFIGHYSEGGEEGRGVSFRHLKSVEGAQGVMFVCPLCQGHQVLCWFTNPRNAPVVPASAFPRPGRWEFSGDTFDAITLKPSIDLSMNAEGCKWHGWVTNGICT